MEQPYLISSDHDNLHRCWWTGDLVDYNAYHDQEWGRPVLDDVRLFEKICLEGFQAGLSWLTILRKREHFRTAFAGFDFRQIALFDTQDVERLVQDKGIIRHRGKIESTINNAQRALEVIEEFGSLSAYFWQFVPPPDEQAQWHADGTADIPAKTPTSIRLSKDLKKRGWKFVGPTTAYAFMQAMGLVNDHHPQCWCHQEAEELRASVKPS